MNFFLVLASTLWSRFLNYCAYFLLKETDFPLYNPRHIISLVIEIFSVFVFLYSSIFLPCIYLPGLWLFFSALLITMHTDAQTMLISRYVTIYMVPLGWLMSFLGFIQLSPLESIIGSLLGLFLLWVSSKASLLLLKTEGLGQGDVDLLCFIGSFTGITGCWITLLLASVSGAISGLLYIIISKKRENIRLPFGVFLSGGGILYVLFKDTFLQLLFSL